MIEELTPESVAAEIKMLREDAGFVGAILLVEGETDACFFSSFLVGTDTLIRSLYGKKNTLAVVALLEQDGVDGVVAIVDADYWYLTGVPSLASNVLITDVHDLDMLLFVSPAFEKVIREYIPPGALRHLVAKHGELKLALLEAVRLIGYLRWINEKESLGINFKKSKNSTDASEWRECLSSRDLEFDRDRVLASLCHSNASLIAHLDQCVRSGEMNVLDPTLLCNGHDAMHVTCLLIRRHGRAAVRDRLDSSDLERAFRLAYESGFLRQTALFQRLQVWQASTGYVL